MIILDTNVISEALSHSPSPAVMDWLRQQDPSPLRITAVTATELAYGIAWLPDGARRHSLATRRQSLRESWVDRVLRVGVDEAEAAGVCGTHEYALATRNVRDFADTPVSLVNPWDV